MWTVRRGCRRLGDNKVKLGPNWVNPPSQDKMLLCLSELSLQAPTGAQTLPFNMWDSHCERSHHCMPCLLFIPELATLAKACWVNCTGVVDHQSGNGQSRDGERERGGERESRESRDGKRGKAFDLLGSALSILGCNLRWNGKCKANIN